MVDTVFWVKDLLMRPDGPLYNISRSSRRRVTNASVRIYFLFLEEIDQFTF